jgi:hypothetical protein
MHWMNVRERASLIKKREAAVSTDKASFSRRASEKILNQMKGFSMKQTLTIPETFLGVGYTKNRAGLPLEAVRVVVPRPEADQVLIRVAASSLNPL